MKQFFSFLLLVVISASINAQNIPNGNFENWGSTSTWTLDDWTVSGDVVQSTDAFEGTGSIRLNNTAATQSRGFITSGPFINNKILGFPYDEQPLSARFQAKFDLALGDQAQVAVIFYLKGNPIGTQVLYIEGTSADTFRYFSLPITWHASTNPDSVAIALSSLDLEENNFNGDGYIIFDDFHFATISTRNREVPNGDFEGWTEKKQPVLTSWYTTDQYLFDLTGYEHATPFVKSTDEGRSGSKGLELVNQTVNNEIIAGVLFTGAAIEDIEKPAFAISNRWKYFEGYYKYSPMGGDAAQLGVALYKDGTIIGGVEFEVSTSSTQLTYFAEEIDYYTAGVPDSAFVFVSSADSDDPKANGTSLIIDDLRFSDWNAGVFDVNVNKLTVYPNPFNNELRFLGADKMYGSEYAIIDVLGHTVKEGILTRNLVLDFSDNLPGIYVLHINGKHINTSKILVKE